MKFLELLEKTFEIVGPNDTIDYKTLMLIEDQIKQTEEFKDVKSLRIISAPVELNKQTGQMTSVGSYISDAFSYGNLKGKDVILYAAFKSPYVSPNPEDFLKQDFALGNALIDPYTFKPKKKILLTYCPEDMQDNAAEEILKLQEKLVDMISNPAKYENKANKIIVRGLIYEKN